MEGLIKIGQPAVKKLLKVMKDKNVSNKNAAMLSAFVLAELAEPQAIDYLINIVEGPENYTPEMRVYAIYSLSKFKDEKAVGAIRRSAFDINDDVRAKAIWALGEIEAPDVFDLFAGALKDASDKVANEAITALGKSGNPKAVAYIKDSLNVLKVDGGTVPGYEFEFPVDRRGNSSFYFNPDPTDPFGAFGSVYGYSRIEKHIARGANICRALAEYNFNGYEMLGWIEIITDQDFIISVTPGNSNNCSVKIGNQDKSSYAEFPVILRSVDPETNQTLAVKGEFEINFQRGFYFGGRAIYSEPGPIQFAGDTFNITNSASQAILNVGQHLGVETYRKNKLKNNPPSYPYPLKGISWYNLRARTYNYNQGSAVFSVGPGGSFRFDIQGPYAALNDLVSGKTLGSGLPIKYLSVETRVRIALALGQIGGPEAEALLTKAAGDDISVVRAAAISMLAQFDGPEIDRILSKGLNDSDPDVRVQAVMALGNKINEKPENKDLILSLLKREKSDKVCLACMNVLSGISQPEVKETLSSFLNNANWQLRQTAALSIAAYQDSAVVGQVLPLLDDAKEEVQLTALSIAADRLKDNPRLFDVVYKKLDSPASLISSNAAIFLSRYVNEYPQLVDRLNQFLKQDDLKLRQGILAGLGQAKCLAAVNMIKPYLKDKNIPIKQTAVLSLGQLGEFDAASSLKSIVNDNSWEVRQAAAISYGAIGNKEALAPLKALTKDQHPLVRQAAAESYARIPEAARMKLSPLLSDENWQVRLSAAKILAPEVVNNPQLVDPFVRLAKTDPYPAVRSSATFGLAGIDQPRVKKVIQQNFQSDDWNLRQSAIIAAGRMDSPEYTSFLNSALKDRDYLVSSFAIYGLGKRIPDQPQIIDNIKPFLDNDHWQVRRAATEVLGVLQDPQIIPSLTPKIQDPAWQVRQVAVASLGQLNNPQIDKLLIPALQDPSVYVRQTAVSDFGTKLNSNPMLIQPLINTLQYDTDSWTKQLAAFSLKTVQEPTLELGRARPLIDEFAPEIKVAVITPGIDDWSIMTPGRVLTQDCTKDWQLRRLLELGGVRVIEQRWSGCMWEIPKVQRDFDNTELNALNLAGKNGAVLNIGYSAGNRVNERLFEHIEAGVNTPITEAIREGRIKVISLNSPSFYDFSKIDPAWKNVCSVSDFFSWPSLMSNHVSIPFTPLYNPIVPSPVFIPNDYNIHYRTFSEFHSAHKDPRVMSDIAHQSFPNLSMPQLDKMLMNQNTFDWRYFPTHGNWPGQYNFQSIAPPNYWQQQQFQMPKLPPPQPINNDWNRR